MIGVALHITDTSITSDLPTCAASARLDGDGRRVPGWRRELDAGERGTGCL